MTEDDTPESLEARCWALRERAERAESERDKALAALKIHDDELAGAASGATFDFIKRLTGERDKALAANKLLVEALERADERLDHVHHSQTKRKIKEALAAVKQP